VALLLAQVGTHTARRFAARVAELGLTPAHVGVLRLVAQRPGLSQQALAEALGVVPSKVVLLVDDLEARRVVERRRDPTDRRQYALHLAADADEELARVRDVVRRHDEDITAALTAAERKQLLALLSKVAAAQGL
jgi:DNA-binding MarR family transcriptional regulator